MDNMLREKADAGSDEEGEAEGSGEDDEDDDDEEGEEEEEEYSDEGEDEEVPDRVGRQGPDSHGEEAKEASPESEDGLQIHKSREPRPQDPSSPGPKSPLDSPQISE